jgi:HAD superfamily hydrolase (TIGR01509 family)
MRNFDLVIFDCDGILIDSERLTVRTEVAILSDLGWPLSESEIVARFVGRSASYMHGEVEAHLGRPIDWETEFESQYRQVFEQELTPVPGILDVLKQIDIATCVASSGGHEKMHFTLGLTGLLAYFDGRIFSADDVPHGKPAPDLFLYAAQQMNCAPSRCVVIEDSVAGVTAAVAAGMDVFGYSGSVTSAADLSTAGAVVFDRMDQLISLLDE